MSLRILLVDDHQMMRDGLRALLASEPGIEIVGEAENGRRAIEMARASAPDLVLMDIAMPDMNGVEATRQIRADNPRTRVIALSTHSDQRSVHAMLDSGAAGYVLKSAAQEELLRAVRSVSAGKTYLGPEVAGLVVKRSTHPGGESTLHSTLGPREREVVQLVAEGKTSAETAERMNISIKTVETHRRNIVQKLGLRGTANLTKYAIREGLTTLEGDPLASGAPQQQVSGTG